MQLSGITDIAKAQDLVVKVSLVCVWGDKKKLLKLKKPNWSSEEIRVKWSTASHSHLLFELVKSPKLCAGSRITLDSRVVHLTERMILPGTVRNEDFTMKLDFNNGNEGQLELDIFLSFGPLQVQPFELLLAVGEFVRVENEQNAEAIWGPMVLPTVAQEGFSFSAAYHS
jgi:hypothetical protein